jgi:hypothetical protein
MSYTFPARPLTCIQPVMRPKKEPAFLQAWIEQGRPVGWSPDYPDSMHGVDVQLQHYHDAYLKWIPGVLKRGGQYLMTPGGSMLRDIAVYLTWWATTEHFSAASCETSRAAIQISALCRLMLSPGFQAQAALTHEPQDGFVVQTPMVVEGQPTNRKRKSVVQAQEDADTSTSSKRSRKGKRGIR